LEHLQPSPRSYKRNEYRKVILPLTVLRRFDCLLAPTKAQVLKQHASIKAKPESVVRSLLEKITGRPFYNLSKLDLARVLDDPNQIALNVIDYTNGFSKNVREIMERFAFDQQIARMAEKNLLYEVIKAFAKIDLSPGRVDNVQMGYVFEELIRIGAEQSNEEAGEHFTRASHQADGQSPAFAGEGSAPLPCREDDLRPRLRHRRMLSVAERYIRDLNKHANPCCSPGLERRSWAVCKSDMLIKGEDADNIRLATASPRTALIATPTARN